MGPTEPRQGATASAKDGSQGVDVVPFLSSFFFKEKIDIRFFIILLYLKNILNYIIYKKIIFIF